MRKSITLKTWAILFFSFCLAGAAGAVEKKYSFSQHFQDHLVLTALVGPGFPSDDFGSSTVGNHETGFQGTLEFEWYFARQTSLGLITRHGTFEDKDLGDDLVTNLYSYGGFIKHTIPVGREWYGYGKFALAWTDLEFEDPGFITKTDGGTGILLGVGLLYRTSELLSIDGQLAFNKYFTEDSDVPGFPGTQVGFDAQYISLDLGVSFYFGTD